MRDHKRRYKGENTATTRNRRHEPRLKVVSDGPKIENKLILNGLDFVKRNVHTSWRRRMKGNEHKI